MWGHLCDNRPNLAPVRQTARPRLAGVCNKHYHGDMTRFGYIRTSRDRQAGQAGMDPETQQQLRAAGVSPANVYRDIGLSGSTAPATRNGWRGLDAKLQAGDTLVVAAVDQLAAGGLT